MQSYPSCGMAYRLHRVDGVVEIPAMWNVGGTAFHECVREWEDQAIKFRGMDLAPPSADFTAERFAHHLAEQIAATVLSSGVAFSSWRCARGGKENREWWLDNAPAWVANYVTAARDRESALLSLDLGVLGTQPALELGFLWTPAPGLPPVKGFIDQVLKYPNGDILIRDLKSGSHRPVDSLQLKVYRLALEDEFGITAPRWWGEYWMARRGCAEPAIDLTERAPIEAEVHARLAVMDAAERSGYYLANPSNMCSACGVRAACPVMGDPATKRPYVLTGQ